jgi:hypothetical protein
MKSIVPHPEIVPHIPIPEDQALAALLRVKPTADMPRPGAHPMKAKKRRPKKVR